MNIEDQTRRHALKQLARRITALDSELADNKRQLTDLVTALMPVLLVQPGIGPISAAQLLVSWSHPGRCRNEAAFANLAGTAPLEASSGRVARHRLSRFDDRQLNRALHTITIARARYDTRIPDYINRRRTEGKNDAEIRRCLNDIPPAASSASSNAPPNRQLDNHRSVLCEDIA
jgi:transposase